MLTLVFSSNISDYLIDKKRDSTKRQLIVQCLTSPPTQYRLYGRRFLQVKRPNQQYQTPKLIWNFWLTPTSFHVN